jgi:uncharacterized membrane protein
MPQTFAIDSGSNAARPAVRTITLTDLQEALQLGWADFLAIPTQLIFLCILYPIVGLVAARAAVGTDLLPLLFPLVAGMALLGPVLAVGIYELSRRRELGLPVSWLNAFDVLRSPAIFSIAMIGCLLLAAFVAWMSVARAIFALTVGAAPGSVGEFVQDVMNTTGGFYLAVIGNAAGALFAGAVLVLTVVSVPMLLDRAVSPGVAIQTSIRAVAANPGVMAAWGIIVGGLLALGCVPLFVGLAVVVPVLGHATWHLYRRVVV